ncbi:hypothetical protein [Microbacterium sp. ABRD28]|uniref:hypothetical protein n=1 Tax=Microbacterium sp. ABRD28 TaxID=2268461 RepID=UPI000F556A1B|nr:hypothetical protein [Microbacterium sp. ABRD28]
MEYTIAFAIVAVMALSVISLLMLRERAQKRMTRDDLQRAGSTADVSPLRATRRAEGKAAWTRLGGGGAG